MLDVLLLYDIYDNYSTIESLCQVFLLNIYDLCYNNCTMVKRGHGWGVKPGGVSTSVPAMHTFVREMVAMDLRIAGHSYEEIWRIMSEMNPEEWTYSSPWEVRRMLVRAMTKVRTGKREEVLDLELRRLDKMLAAVWYQAVGGIDPDGEEHAGGHLGAMKAVLSIEKERNRITGLYAPIKVARTDSKGKDIVTMSDEEAGRRVIEILMKAQERMEQGDIVDGEFTEPTGETAGLLVAVREEQTTIDG
jgi:hypothetical protein